MLRRALERGLTPSLYTKELFATGHDAANRAAVARVATQALDLVGLGCMVTARRSTKLRRAWRCIPEMGRRAWEVTGRGPRFAFSTKGD